MSIATRRVTADELFQMPDEETRWCELVDGEIVHMSPPGFAHGVISQRLGVALGSFVSSRKLGIVVAAETGFVVQRNPDSVLAPDGSFVRQDRLDAIGVPRSYFPEAPALVYEVVSPSETVREVGDKVRRWFAAGVELIWILDPHTRTVTAYRSLDDAQILTAKDALTGEDVVPGFECRVADLFDGV